jgi:DNA repair exonuclease SbcCD ATPase subunit
MARRCKSKECTTELPPASKCTDIVQKKGYCSVKCLADHTAQKRVETQERKERKKLAEAKERVKTRSQWQKEAQAAFNAYIRERDKDLPCVSCGRHHDGQYHAGHYRTTASAPQLRFDERNVWKQCAPCNNHLSGNIANYRPELIKRIGLEQVEDIENNSELKRWTIEELKQIKAKYKAKLKELKHNS